MKRIFTFLIMLAFALSAALVLMVGEPERARAGGWPCFLCHGGFEVPGTDIAPQLAGSKLTDAQIINQVRHPRGMMPSFSELDISDRALKDGFIQPFVRGLPAGKPTATLSAANRSAAYSRIVSSIRNLPFWHVCSKTISDLSTSLESSSRTSSVVRFSGIAVCGFRGLKALLG